MRAEVQTADFDIREYIEYISGRFSYIEIYNKYILRIFGIVTKEGYETELTEKYKLVQTVYEYVFGRDTEEYFKEADISRNLKEICINACNGLRL